VIISDDLVDNNILHMRAPSRSRGLSLASDWKLQLRTGRHDLLVLMP